MQSLPVYSSQTGCHQQLENTVLKHQRTVWQQPIRAHTRQAFSEFLAYLQDASYAGIILDCGCGTGASSQRLALRFPKQLVVGIDQSAERLGRGILRPEYRKQLIAKIPDLDNGILIRAEVADFWRLLAQLPVDLKPSVQTIYLYYPNPWPKPAHLQRRWHGHPVFPLLLALKMPIILRSNWKIYIDEFARAVRLVSGANPEVIEIPLANTVDKPVSPFEKKYALSGHTLWQLTYQP